MQDIKERESLEIVDQSQTQRYVSRFEPLLHVPVFTQKDFYYNVHTGFPTQETSTEDLSKYNQECTTLLSNKHNLYTRGKAQQQSPLHLEGWALSQTTITSHQRDKNQRMYLKGVIPLDHVASLFGFSSTRFLLHNVWRLKLWRGQRVLHCEGGITMRNHTPRGG